MTGLLQKAVLFASDAAESAAGSLAAETVTVTTPYSDTLVPVFTLFALVAGAVLLIIALFAVFFFLKDRTRDWLSSLISGLAAYVLIAYGAYVLLFFGLSKIPGMDEVLGNGEAPGVILQNAVAVVLDIVACVLGLKYCFRADDKANRSHSVGMPFGYSFGVFIAIVFISNQISYSFNYFSAALAINQNGFDSVVSAVIENGANEEDAITNMLAFAKTPGWVYLADTLSYLCKLVYEAGAAILIYGVLSQKLEKKYMWIGFSFLVFDRLPVLLGLVGDTAKTIGIIAMFLLTVFVAYFTLITLKKYLADDYKSLSYSRRAEKKRKSNTPPPMPHINMPKD